MPGLFDRARGGSRSRSLLGQRSSEPNLTTPGDPDFLARYTDSGAQTPSAYSEQELLQKRQQASRTLQAYSDGLSSTERETLLEIAEKGYQEKDGMFTKVLEFIDRPRELIMMGIADITGLDRGNEIRGGDYVDSVLGRDATLKDKFGDLAGDGKFAFTGSDLLEAAGVENKAVRAVGGFIGDVAIDPLTYTGVGFLASGRKAAVEGIQLATRSTLRESLEGLLTKSAQYSDDAVRRFAGDISKSVDEVAPSIERALGDDLLARSGRDWLTPAELDNVARDAREMALIREASALNKVLPDVQKLDLPDYADELVRFTDDALEEGSETVVQRVYNETSQLVGDRQFATQEFKYGELVNSEWTPASSTGGLKLYLPFSSAAIDLGLRSNSPIRSNLKPFAAAWFERLPAGMRQPVKTVFDRRGWEVPTLGLVKEGKAWQISAAKQLQDDLLASLGTREAPGALSVALRSLKGQAEQVGVDSDEVDRLLSRALDTPDLRGLRQEIPDDALYETFVETAQSVRFVTETLRDAVREFDPDFKGIDGYLTLIRTKDFTKVLDAIRAEGVSLRGAEGLDSEVRQGLALLNQYVAAANVSGSMAGAYDLGVSRFMKARKAGRTAFAPVDPGVDIVDKDVLGQIYDLGSEVGFMPREDMNQSIGAAIGWLVDRGRLNPRSVPKNFEAAFDTNVSNVLNTYVTSMTEALKFRAFARAARQVGLINRQEFDIDVAESLVQLAASNTDEVKGLVRRALEVTRGKKKALESLQAEPRTVPIRIGPFEVEVNAAAVADPRFQDMYDQVSRKVTQSAERAREVVADQETRVRQFVDMGIPEEMARPMAAATNEASLREARVVIETEANFQAAQLKLAADEALAKARTPAEIELAEKGMREARRQARNIRARAIRKRQKLYKDWSERFRMSETTEVSTQFDLTAERLQAMDQLIGVEVQKDIDAAAKLLGSFGEQTQREFRNAVDELTARGATLSEQEQVFIKLDTARRVEAETAVLGTVRVHLRDIAAVTNARWRDLADEVSPVGLYDLAQQAVGRGSREVQEYVTIWKRSVASRNSATYRQLIDPAEAAAEELVGDEAAARRAYDAILEWVEGQGKTVGDIADSYQTFDDLFDPLADKVWRKLNAEVPGSAPDSWASMRTGWSMAVADYAATRFPGAEMLRALEPTSKEAALRAAMRAGDTDTIAAQEGLFRSWMDRIGLDPDGFTVQRDPRTGRHSISYSQVTERTTYSHMTVDSIMGDLDKAFPDTSSMAFDDRLGFLKDLLGVQPERFDDVPMLRRFLDQMDEAGSMPPEVRQLGEIDRMFDEVSNLRAVANAAGRSIPTDASTAWNRVRRELENAIEGGPIGPLRKTWDAEGSVLRGLDADLGGRIDYMVDYLEAMREAVIPKYMIDRNMRWTEQVWESVDDQVAKLQAFGDETARLAQDGELKRLTQQIEDLENFRTQVASMVTEFGGRSGAAGTGLREAADATLTLSGEAAQEFQQQYSEVAELAQRIGMQIGGNLYGLDIEDLARQFPALPLDADNKAIAKWLEEVGGPLRDLPTRAAAAPVSEGFLPPEAVGVAAGRELAGGTMDQWTAIMLENMLGHMRASQSAAGVAAFAENANQITRLWKTAATIGRPTFVPRNIMGGMYNNFIMGVRPKDYRRVALNVRKFRDAYAKTGRIDDAIRAVPDDFQSVMRAMVDSDLLNTGFNHELQQVIEDTAPTLLSRLNPTDIQNFEFYRRNARFMQDSEDFLRAAAFVRWYDPSNPASAGFAKTMSLTAHFDYDNLTGVEQSIKRLIPFFVWSRRNIPLQIQAAVERPGVMMTYKHLMTNIDTTYEDPTYDQFAESQYLSGFAASTGFVLNEGTPFWGRIILDPDVPVKDLDEALTALGDGDGIKFITSLINPGVTLPFDMQATAEFGDVNAPAGLHATLRLLHSVGLFNDVSQTGDPQVSYNTRRIAETAVPFAGEFSNLLGQQNDPGRAARLGITTEDGTSLSERLRAAAITLAKAGGVSVQTPQDTRGAAFEAGDTTRGILEAAELQGRIDRER